MPNYVRNLIKIVGGDFQTVADFMKSEERPFDFNKLIPMPPSMLYLKKYKGISLRSELGFKYWSAPTKRDKYTLIEEIKTKCYNVRQTLKEGLDRLYAYADSGHWNSLEWAEANWGTKWNAVDIDVNSSDRTIFFNTAWCAPIPIYKALAKKFPTHKISIKYYDEGGWFAGYSDIKDGNEFGEDYESNSTQGEAIINEINQKIKGWYSK